MSPVPGTTTPCRSASASLPSARSNRSRSSTSRAIANGDDGSIRIFPSQSRVMNANRGSTAVVGDGEVQPVPLADQPPVVDRRAAQRVDPDPQPGRPYGLEVDDVRRGRPRTWPGSRTAPPLAIARSTGTRWTPSSPSDPDASRIRLASSWIQRVTSVSAGPPLGGLYLKPPSSGGLCDGVTTIPSASPADRPRFATRIACDTAGVGVYPSSASTRTSTPFATSTSSAVRHAGSGEGVRVPADEQRAGGALRRAVAADRLGRREDVGLVERGAEAPTRGAPRSRTPPAGRARRGRAALVVGADEGRRCRRGRRGWAGWPGARVLAHAATLSRRCRQPQCATHVRSVVGTPQPTDYDPRNPTSTSYGARPRPPARRRPDAGARDALDGRRFLHGDRDVRSRVQAIRRRDRRIGPQPRDRGRRVHGARRAVGLREDDQPADDRGTRGDHRGRAPHRRQGRQRRRAQGPRHRDGVPELRALPAHDGPRQPRVRAQAAQGRPSPRSRSAISEAAGILQLEQLLERKPKELSGGQRQRVALGPGDRPRAAPCSSWTSRCPTSTPSCASRPAPRSRASTSASARRRSTSPTTRSRR